MGAARTLNQWLTGKITYDRFSSPTACYFAPVHWTVTKRVHWPWLLKSSQHLAVQWIFFTKYERKSWMYLYHS